MFLDFRFRGVGQGKDQAFEKVPNYQEIIMDEKFKRAQDFINEVFSIAELFVVRLTLFALLIAGVIAVVLHHLK